MNQKKKADLQRKLSMTAVPKPPGGLAERIKADIPHDLRMTQPERVRRFLPAAFTLRLAASLVLVLAAAYVVLQLATRYDLESVMPNVSRHKSVAAAPQSTAEVTIDLEEAKQKTPRAAAVAKKAAPPAAPPAMQEARRDQPQPQFAPEPVETRMKDEAQTAQSTVVTAAAAPAAAAPPTVVGGVVADSAARARRPANVVARAEVMKTGRNGELVAGPPREIFGLSVDPSAFDRVKQKIDEGQRPAPGSIDVAGLVNYFAGSAKAPLHEVRLDVEGSRAPSGPNAALIHFSVETPRVTVPPGALLPPAGTDADLAITLNSDAVVSHRLIGADSLKSESMLVKNTSVTGVVEVELLPNVSPTETVATLRLRYRSAIDGKPRTITKFVRAWELKRDWDAATRRHRLATLSALWSESVNGGESARGVAEQAEKLATEVPGDARARELAAAASAFSRLRSSGPTGSGR